MSKRISDEERVLNYFMTAIENEALTMAEKVVLIVRTRFGSNPKMGPLLAPRQPVGRPRKRAGGSIDVKMREPEAQRELKP